MGLSDMTLEELGETQREAAAAAAAAAAPVALPAAGAEVTMTGEWRSLVLEMAKQWCDYAEYRYKHQGLVSPSNFALALKPRVTQ